MKIGIIITELRKKRRWSQADLALKSGVSREMIGKYERNDAVPSILAAGRISKALGVTLDFLLSEGDTISYADNNSIADSLALAEKIPEFGSSNTGASEKTPHPSLKKETMILEILHPKAHKLLVVMEELRLINILKQGSEQPRLSDKYAGKLSAEVADDLQNYIAQSRKEWESRNLF